MQIIPSVRFLLFAVVVLTVVTLANPMASVAQVGISITFGPPALPVYEQPPCPAEGYLWTPGYWAYDYDDGDYFWVPGTWVLAPQVGFLWTPGWWGWGGSAFIFHEGYWGPTVGFYGGISYGFGYFGEGYEGGRWDGDHFSYNRAVNNVNVTNIHNTYNTTVINNTTVNRVSYNGGDGGVQARATPEQERAANERHIAPVAVQTQHVQAARANRDLRASVNQGKPAIAATARPGELKGNVVPAKEAGAPYHPPANRGGAQQGGNEQKARPENNVPRPGAENNARPENNAPRPGAENNAARPEEGNNASRPNAVHPNELPAHEHPTPPNTGNTKMDKKYQDQQQKLAAQQDKERQKLQQQQEQEHQKMAKQMADEKQKQQIEQRHQQQTQQLEQRHAQQQQQLQERQPRTQPQERPSEPKPPEPKR